jgi:hypothetical protein
MAGLTAVRVVGFLGAQCLGGAWGVLAWDARPEGSGFVTVPNGHCRLASAALDPCDDTDLVTNLDTKQNADLAVGVF